MNKYRISILVILTIFLMTASIQASVIKAVVPEADSTGTFPESAEFTIDLHFLNDYATQLGFSLPLKIYSPNGSITSILHRNVGGHSVFDWRGGGGFIDSSILEFNGWNETWNLLNDFYGFGWDGILPDTLNHTAISLNGWNLDSDTTHYISIALRSDMPGTLCIDTCSIPDVTPTHIFDWIFEDPNVYWEGPFCWNIGYDPYEYIYVQPNFINAIAYESGPNPPDQQIQITATYDGTTWYAEKNAEWLTLSQDSGSAPGTLYLSFDVTGLTFGEYYDTVIINSPAVVNGPKLVTVKLAVFENEIPMSRTWIVKADGSGDAPTIQAAIDSANILDTVLVDMGTYTETINFRGKHIVVKSIWGPQSTKITNSNEFDLVTMNSGEGINTIFEGFSLEGGHIGIFIDNAYPIIRHNLLYNQYPDSMGTITVITPYDSLILDSLIAPARLINNTVVRSAGGGINIMGYCPTMIKNNIVAFNVGYGIGRPDSDVATNIDDLSYNDVFDNTINYLNISDPGIGSFSLNPEFIAGYAYLETSPCVDAGDPSPMYNDPDGSRNDLGAIPYLQSDIIGLVNFFQWRDVNGGNNHWYGIYPEVHYWEDANSIAGQYEHNGMTGYLATITSPEENQFILETIIDDIVPGTNPNEFWLGGYDAGINSWQWITGEPFAYTNWYPGEPNNVGTETALAIFLNGEWNNSLPNGDIHNLHRYWSIIEFGPPDTVISTEYINLKQWSVGEGGNDHWYAVVPKILFWNEAMVEASLTSLNGVTAHLATVTSQAENDFIFDSIIVGTNQPSIEDQFWLGGRNDYGMGWKWITDEPFEYTNWAPNEPNNGPDVALSMWGYNGTGPTHIPGKWNDAFADDSINSLHKWWSVIEWEAVPPQDTLLTPTNEWISIYCAEPHIDGNRLQPGDIIKAYDPDGVLCGYDVVKLDGSFGFMAIYHDDIFTNFDEGAEEGDIITFTINNVEMANSVEIIWTANGDIFQLCGFSEGGCLEIQLNQGWNLISWNVLYIDTIQNLISEIEECVDVVLTFSGGAFTYDPDLPEFSDIPFVAPGFGYWFRMDCPAVLRVCGEPMNSDRAIWYNVGWNLIGYFPNEEYLVADALNTSISDIDAVLGFENGGLTWLPGYEGFNTLTYMKPGHGYWLKAHNFGALVYPGFIINDPDCMPIVTKSEGTEEIVSSRTWVSVYGRNIKVDNTNLEDYSVIEARTTDGTVCGRGIYSGNMLKFTPVYGYDEYQATTAKYASNSETVELYVNDIRVYPDITFGQMGDRIEINELSTSKNGNSGLKPNDYQLHQNYPNPFNPKTIIQFDLPAAGDVQLTVYNIAGQRVATLVDERLEAGAHQIEWIASDIATGIYFYHIEADQFSDTKKMTLLK
ncbi:MAG: lectin-like protein [Candidatus Zixiibacteriota bacterium]